MTTNQVIAGTRPTTDSDVAPPGRGTAWTMAAMLFTFIVIAYVDKAVLGLVAQPVMKEFKLSATQFGLIGTAAGLLGPPAALLYSFLADRLPVKATLFVLAVVWSLVQLPLFFVASAGLMLSTRFALGAAEGPAFPAAHSTMYSWFPNDRRGIPAALLTSGASVAKLAVAPALTVIIVAYGWRAAFLSVAVLGFAWSLLWLPIGRGGPYGQAQTARHSKPRVPLRQILLTRTFVGCVIGMFVSSMLQAVVLTWLPSYFQKVLGFSPIAAGALFGLPSIAAMVFLLGFSGWSDRMLRRGTTSRTARGATGFAVLVAGGAMLIVLPFASNVGVALALITLGFGLTMTVHSLASPATAEIAPPERRAGVLAIMLAFAALGGILSPWLSGMILDAASSPSAGYGTAFRLLGVIIVAGGVVYGLLVNPDRDRAGLANNRA